MEWINVNDALPNIEDMCVVRTKYGEYEVGEFTEWASGKYSFVTTTDAYAPHEITHWARFNKIEDFFNYGKRRI